MLEGGEAPRAELERVCGPYPWVTISSVEAGTRYGDVKALAGDRGTGEIIVLCDADVRYEPDWLERLLEPFARDDVQIASGETTTPVTGPYSLAIALTFVFPRYSGDSEPAPALWYWANNVAARRDFLAQLPLPQHLPIYRGQTIVHGKALREAGHTIWRVPGARAVHDVPSLRELLPRFVLKGHDSLAIARLVDDPSGRSYMGGMERRDAPQGQGSESPPAPRLGLRGGSAAPRDASRRAALHPRDPRRVRGGTRPRPPGPASARGAARGRDGPRVVTPTCAAPGTILIARRGSSRMRAA